ncbi:hypothetical protein HZC53_05630 [Candidatus Uhrbacteria bacterium]|nr:hypothetical protein [Candidatus Uhrbacteria bacterium]
MAKTNGKAKKKTTGRKQKAGLRVAVKAVKPKEKVSDSVLGQKGRIQPCDLAFKRVAEALSPEARTKLAHELALLQEAVRDCPGECGCGKCEKFCIIFTNEADFLGELTTREGRFINLRLSILGENTLGDAVRSWQIMGLRPVGAESEPTMLRDGKFLESFLSWCHHKDFKTVELLEPQISIWTSLQCLPMHDCERYAAIEELACLPLHEAEGKLTDLC